MNTSIRAPVNTSIRAPLSTSMHQLNTSMHQLSTSVKQYSYCPFDNNHLIEACKLLKHIKKCKSPTRRDFVECPHNPYHWLNFHEMEDHILECPDQGMLASDFLPPTIPTTEVIKHPLMAGNSSFISEISRVEGEDDSQQGEMLRMALDFHNLHKQKEKPSKGHQFKKKFNHQELQELNREKLWQEPDFSHWIERHYVKGDLDGFEERRAQMENSFLAYDL